MDCWTDSQIGADRLGPTYESIPNVRGSPFADPSPLFWTLYPILTPGCQAVSFVGQGLHYRILDVIQVFRRRGGWHQSDAEVGRPRGMVSMGAMFGVAAGR